MLVARDFAECYLLLTTQGGGMQSREKDLMDMEAMGLDKTGAEVEADG
jgi:hypothetical protein